MYCQTHFREDRPEELRALIRRHPLGTLITAAGGLDANLIPFTLAHGPDGRDLLRAHLPKSSDQVAALRSGAEALVSFRGPEGYVSPGWYATKAEHGKVVPTWNYVLVQAWGQPLIIDDSDWIMAQIQALTAQQEAGRAKPWAVADAPADFTAKLVGTLVGLEIPIERMKGKWKVSQNQPEANRRGVAEGLRQQNPALAALVAERGGIS
jgi:transcriptional regulator